MQLLAQAKDHVFEVSWGSSSFAIKLADPAGSGTMFSLCIVTNTGTLYTYLDWLKNQLKSAELDDQATARVSEAHAALFRRFGAQPTPGGLQLNLKLTALAGREAEFVDGLKELATLIEKMAPKDGGTQDRS